MHIKVRAGNKDYLLDSKMSVLFSSHRKSMVFAAVIFILITLNTLYFI